MLHLSFEGIVHRDLAARNVLLTKQLDAKISDFGMSRKVERTSNESQTKQNIGPVKWMVYIQAQGSENFYSFQFWLGTGMFREACVFRENRCLGVWSYNDWDFHKGPTFSKSRFGWYCCIDCQSTNHSIVTTSSVVIPRSEIWVGEMFCFWSKWKM